MTWSYYEASNFPKLKHVVRVADHQNELHDSAIHTQVDFTWKLKRDFYQWMLDHIPRGEWHYDVFAPTEFCFATKQQAMLFKLTWSNGGDR